MSEYLGDYNGVHKYLKQKEEKSSCKLLWHLIRFCEMFLRSLGEVSNKNFWKCYVASIVLFQTVFCEQSILQVVYPHPHLHQGPEGRSHFLALHPHSLVLVDNGVSIFNFTKTFNNSTCPVQSCFRYSNFDVDCSLGQIFAILGLATSVLMWINLPL